MRPTPSAWSISRPSDLTKANPSAASWAEESRRPAGAPRCRCRRLRRLPEDDFVGHFAADVDPAQAKVMYAVQQPLSMSTFGDVMGVPAWRSLPTWYMVAENDEAIPPDAERSFATRMGATVVEVATSHVAMVSHPADVVALIEAGGQRGGISGLTAARAWRMAPVHANCSALHDPEAARTFYPRAEGSDH